MSDVADAELVVESLQILPEEIVDGLLGVSLSSLEVLIVGLAVAAGFAGFLQGFAGLHQSGRGASRGVGVRPSLAASSSRIEIAGLVGDGDGDADDLVALLQRDALVAGGIAAHGTKAGAARRDRIPR